MITFSRFGGPTAGRLGNSLWQLASLLGFSKTYDCQFQVPNWKYDQYFDSIIPHGNPRPIHIELQEPEFHYIPQWWEVHRNDFKTKNVNIFGWLQSEKYFEHCKDDVRAMFKFKEDFKQATIAQFKHVFEKPVIAITVRRGDFVTLPGYETIPIKYYLLALLTEFPDFRENYNLLIFSDDFEYCKLHFACLPNAYFAEGLSDIEQLCLGSSCQHAIISNSTFSWWIAYLLETPTSKIVRPNFLFAGDLKKRYQEQDYYPERWICLDHKIQWIDLKDVTFTIPVKFDSLDRKQNLDLALKLLMNDFDTHIIVGEQGHTRFEYTKDIVRYVNFDTMKLFHRTKMLNDMAVMATTPIVVNYDADVVMSPVQIVEAAHKIRTKQAEMVYPYDGRFARVLRTKWLKVIEDQADVGMFGNTMFNGMFPKDALSVGGCIMFEIAAFLRGGMENEYFISYGPEDAERYDRFTKLRFKVARIPGALYHFDHVLSRDSGMQHPHFLANRKEMEKGRKMSYEELRAYVDSWPWAQRYLPSYYESILESSVKSRDKVFAALEDMGILQKGMRIIDAGCALGNWGYQLEGYDYTGIDFGVPKDKLVIKPEQYIDWDLRKTIKDLVNLEGIYEGSIDLVLCLECAEHIEEEYADVLIDNLCRFGDTILFSAAIICQGGVNHMNEQWQSYWAEKFSKHNYFPYKLDIRELLLDDPEVECWYSENMVLYCKHDPGVPHVHDYRLDYIHPKMYMNILKHYRIIK